MQTKQTALLVGVLVLIGVVIFAKTMKSSTPQQPVEPAEAADVVVPAAAEEPVSTEAPDEPAADKALPKLLDLGSVGCVACKQMEPVLADLKKELAGKVDVGFIDIAVDEAAADKYEIQLIPTQIFFDADGKELFRQTGAYPKEQILEKMTELGMIAD